MYSSDAPLDGLILSIAKNSECDHAGLCDLIVILEDADGAHVIIGALRLDGEV
jgi:hypothetical protein